MIAHVGGAERPRCRPPRLREIAFLVELEAGLGERGRDGGVLADELVAVVGLGSGALLPRRLERGLALVNRLEAGADDADAPRQPDHVDHARDGTGGRVVERVERTARNGRAQDSAVDHVRHLGVDAEFRAADDLVRKLDARQALADQPELSGLLEIGGRHLRKLGWHLGKLRDVAVTDPPSGALVDDHTRLCGQFADRNIPLGGDGVEQDAPRLGSGQAQGHEEAPRGSAGGDDLGSPEAGIAVHGIRRRWNHLHLRPVGVQLLRDDDRHAGHGSLSHLDGGRDDRDRVIGIDRHPDVRRQAAGLSRSARDPASTAEIASKGECQPGRRTDDELASGHVDGHGYASPRAARSTARTMRPYVPQRQRLPFMAWMI